VWRAAHPNGIEIPRKPHSPPHPCLSPARRLSCTSGGPAQACTPGTHNLNSPGHAPAQSPSRSTRPP
jgi:hypothetical protein